MASTVFDTDALGGVQTIFLFSIGVLLGAYVFYQRFLHPLAGIPGPYSASLSRLWITRLSWKGGAHTVMPALHRKYGSIVRVAPTEVSIANPAAVKKIYAAGSGFRKSDWYSVWQGHRKFDLFPERDERLHGVQRRLVSRAYSMESLRDLEPYVESAIVHLFSRFEDIRSQSIDIGKWVQLFAFDVIGEVTFSKQFGFMDAGADDGSFGQIKGALQSASWLGQVPWLYWIHDSLSPYIGNHLAVNARHGSIRNFAIHEVESRTDRGTDRKDILSKLFAVHEEKPKDFDLAALQSMATSNIFAGSDTTAMSARAIIYFLLKNPSYKNKLVAEIDQWRSGGKLSDPIKLEQADNMPYLQACMHEALRCHPVTGMLLPRVVPKGGFGIDGHFLPAGTTVGVNTWVLHKDKDIFGDDADCFNPDRWLKGDVSDMHRFFYTFGAGSRICIGKNIAWMELSKLIPTLFMRYNIELTDPSAEWKITSWWFALQEGIIVNLRPRV